MTKVIDSSFGEIEYKYGWIKQLAIVLWGDARNMRIKAAAFTGEEITQQQRDSYQYFLKNMDAISIRSLELANDYLKENYEKGEYGSAKEAISPRTILFKKDGSFGILCDFTLDEEHGLAICISPKEEVGMQDILL